MADGPRGRTSSAWRDVRVLLVTTGVMLAVGLALGLLATTGASMPVVDWHGRLSLIALGAPLGACALAFVGAPRAARVALWALVPWGVGVALLFIAALERDGGWTFYSPYSALPVDLVLAQIGGLAVVVAMLVAAVAGTHATWRTAPWTSGALALTGVVALVLFVEIARTGPLDPTMIDLELLWSAALALPAAGVLATAARRAPWVSATMIWALVGASTLVAGVATQLIQEGAEIHLHDTVYVVASRHYLMFTALAGVVGGAFAASSRDGVGARYTALVFGIGAHLAAAPGLTLGERGMPRRYAIYLDGDVIGPSLSVLVVVGAVVMVGALVASVVLLVVRREEP